MIDELLCSVMNGCKDENGIVDTEEAVETLREVAHDLVIHLQKIELFSSLSDQIDECNGNILITAIPMRCDPEDIVEPKTFAQFLDDKGFTMRDSDGELISNDQLNDLIDMYIKYTES